MSAVLSSVYDLCAFLTTIYMDGAKGMMSVTLSNGLTTMAIRFSQRVSMSADLMDWVFFRRKVCYLYWTFGD